MLFMIKSLLISYFLHYIHNMRFHHQYFYQMLSHIHHYELTKILHKFSLVLVIHNHLVQHTQYSPSYLIFFQQE